MHVLLLFQKRDMNSTKNFMTKSEKNEKKIGVDKLTTTLTDQHDDAAAMLTASGKEQERPTPINFSVSSGWGSL